MGVSASGVVEDNGPFILNTPPSLSQCALTNITWTGGMPPYTLRVNFGIENVPFDFEPLVIGTDISATHFLWINDVAAGTVVLLEVIDTLGVHEFAGNAIVVDDSSGFLCSDPFFPVHKPSSSPGSATPTLSASTPVFSTSSAHGTVTATVSVPPNPVSSNPPAQVVVQQSPSVLSGSSMALIVLGGVIILLLGTFLWWCSCVALRRRQSGKGEHPMPLTYPFPSD